MAQSFATLLNQSSLEGALKLQNIIEPTPVQVQAIPFLITGKDGVFQAETGTGKTLAYLLPLFQTISTELRTCQALILVPTHELAVQVQKQAQVLAQNSGISLKSYAVLGEVNIQRQIEKLKEKPQLIVGTPGRILELIKLKKIPAHTVKTIILDEADRLLDRNNGETVKGVIKTTLRDRQLMAFSASLGTGAISELQTLMKDPQIFRTQTAALPGTIIHGFLVCEQRDKPEALRKLLSQMKPSKALVFVNTANSIEQLTAALMHSGIKADFLHGLNKKLERQKALDSFRTGKVSVLVASDLAARGLDIQGVTHVFCLDSPEESGSYLHRAGRTGRQGASGQAWSLVTEWELQRLHQYEKDLEIKIQGHTLAHGHLKPWRESHDPG